MYEDFIAGRLARLRTQKGVSARDMSLSIGQADNYINSIENKKSLPSMTAFFYICDYLNVTPQEFFNEEVANPTLLGKVVEVLKPLNENALTHILGIAEEMRDNKK